MKYQIVLKNMVMITVAMMATIAFADPEVSRHQFTSLIEDREPTDALTDVMNVSPLFYFTELTAFQGTSVIHRWSYNDKVMAEVSFNVGGPRWRVYSSKKIQSEWDGDWKVEVIDDAGVVVATDAISVMMD